jgi:ribosomal protein L14E/L6E/L27E
LEQTPELSNVIRCEICQPGPLITTTPIRTAKAKAIAKLSEVIKIQRRVKNENEEQRHRRLEDMRKRQLERVKNENEEQRHTRLEDIRQRASERVKNENE